MQHITQINSSQQQNQSIGSSQITTLPSTVISNIKPEKPKLVVLWTRDRDNPTKPRNSNDYCKINAPGSCIFTRNKAEYEVSSYLDSHYPNNWII